MEIEEHADDEEAATTRQAHQAASSSSKQCQESITSGSTSSFSETDNLSLSQSQPQQLWSSVTDAVDSYRCTLRMVIPYTDPPRQETLMQPLPSTINFPKLPFMDPAQLKPINLGAPLSVANMSLDPDIASKIQAMYLDREMSAYAPKSSKSRAIVPLYCRRQLWSARKHVFSKLGVPCISGHAGVSGSKHVDLLRMPVVGTILMAKRGIVKTIYKCRQLLTAVRYADSSKVLHYLEEGADPNMSDSKGRTPLHIAASQGLNDIASHLLSWRADPNRKDILKNTPLHLAVCRGDTRVVNILLRNGANINLKDGVGRTALCIVQSRLGTLRRDRSISTDKLINECQMISDILRVHCSSQPYHNVQAAVHSAATDNVLSSSAIDDLCSMMKTISTREQADELADTMIETMSQMRIRQAEEKKYSLSIL